MTGSIVFLNGASSAGKSTIAAAAQRVFPAAFWHYSIDHLLQARVLPTARIESGESPWAALREPFFEGYHRSIPVWAGAGNHLIVEHIVESERWMQRLTRLLRGLDVFMVGVHCPLDELQRREAARGDRPAGMAATDFEIAHRHCAYDLEIDGTQDPAASAEALLRAWQARGAQRAIDRMATRLDGGAPCT